MRPVIRKAVPQYLELERTFIALNQPAAAVLPAVLSYVSRKIRL